MNWKGESIVTAPNVLSAYRLLSTPLVIALLALHRESLFLGLITFNYLTDILDGILARKLNQHTSFGARLDSLADNAMYALVAAGLLVFKWEFVLAYRWWLSAFVAAYLLRHVVSFARFGKSAGLHIDSVRLFSLLQVAYVVVLFLWGVVPFLFYPTVILSILSFLEEIAIVAVLKEPRVQTRGLFQVLREQRSDAARR